MKFKKGTKEYNQLIEWITALRSGKFKQARSVLEDGKGAMCCLGVACKLFIPENKLETGTYFTKGVPGPKVMFGSLPIDQKHAPNWLKDLNDDFVKKTRYNYFGYTHDVDIENYGLANLNDEVKLSFSEIADLLEAVYVLDVLKW